MATLRVSERHEDGEIVQRVELSDDSGEIRYLRTNPSNDDKVLLTRLANSEEKRRFMASIDPEEPEFTSIERADLRAMLAARL